MFPYFILKIITDGFWNHRHGLVLISMKTWHKSFNLNCVLAIFLILAIHVNIIFFMDHICSNVLKKDNKVQMPPSLRFSDFLIISCLLQVWKSTVKSNDLYIWGIYFVSKWQRIVCHGEWDLVQFYLSPWKI